jgi:hypothetical protein
MSTLGMYNIGMLWLQAQKEYVIANMRSAKPALNPEDIEDKAQEFDELITEATTRAKTPRWDFVNYNTKTALKQAIQVVNTEINDILIKKRTASEATKDFLDITMEKCLNKKKKLAGRLAYFDRAKTEGLGREAARAVPIDQLMEFNRAGFAKCLWHEEKTGSLKYYPKTNHVYCFAGCGKHDSIDTIMMLRKVDFKTAVNILNNKI